MVGLFWLVLTQLLPRQMSTLAIVLAVVALLGMACILLFDNPEGWTGN